MLSGLSGKSDGKSGPTIRRWNRRGRLQFRRVPSICAGHSVLCPYQELTCSHSRRPSTRSITVSL